MSVQLAANGGRLMSAIFSRVAIRSIERKRVLLQVCRLSHLSVCLSVCPESVLWQNGLLDPDAV